MKVRIIDGNKEYFVDATQIGTANVLIPDVPCLASVYEGAAVYIDSDSLAKNAIATSMATSNVIGIVESKTSTTECNIRVLGVTAEIFTSLDVAKEYFLSDSIAGQLIDTIPTASGHVVLKMGQPYSDKKFLVLKGFRTIRG